MALTDVVRLLRVALRSKDTTVRCDVQERHEATASLVGPAVMASPGVHLCRLGEVLWSKLENHGCPLPQFAHFRPHRLEWSTVARIPALLVPTHQHGGRVLLLPHLPPPLATR